MEQVNAIELIGITKRFGPVVANDNVSMVLKRGEILSLLGENGSGKTTLMNMLSGIYFPDEGEIHVKGQPVTIASPKDAFACGIGMIHQHFKLVDVFTATENVVLGLEEEGRLDLKAAAGKIREICDKYGFVIDPEKKVYDMSVSEKQTVEIIKVLYRGADILILDEPTAVLTPQETDRLFDVMRNMKADGKALIIITHKLHEVMDVSDRVAVLRKGRYIGDVATKDTTPQKLTDMMVGRTTTLNINRPEPKDPTPRLEVKNLTIHDAMGVKRVDNVTFTAMGGEILGIAGVAGSGQKELLEAVAGLQIIDAGASNHRRRGLYRIPGHRRRGEGSRPVGGQDAPPDQGGGGGPGLCAGGPAGYGTGRLSGYDRQYAAAQLPPGPRTVYRPEAAGGAGRAHQGGAGGGHSQHQLSRPPSLRRQRAEGAGGP